MMLFTVCATTVSTCVAFDEFHSLGSFIEIFCLCFVNGLKREESVNT